MNEVPSDLEYELVHRIGVRGTNAFWIGRDATGTLALVRTIPRSDDTAYDRMLQFQRLAAERNDLLRVLRVGRTATGDYCAYEFVDSVDTIPVFAFEAYRPRTLRTVLDRVRRLPPERAASTIRTIAAGLFHLHDAGWTHGALGAESVVFVDGTPKLVDTPFPGGTLVPVEVTAADAHARVTADRRDLGTLLEEVVLGLRPDDDGRRILLRSRDRRVRQVLNLAARISQPGEASPDADAWLNALDRAGTTPPTLRPWILTLPRRLLRPALWAVALAAAATAVSVWQRTTNQMTAPEVRTAIAAPAEPDTFLIPHALQMFRPGLLVPASPDFDLTNGFTIEMWMLPSTLAGVAGILGREPRTQAIGSWEINARSDALETNLGGIVARSPPMLSLLHWQHVAVSWDPATMVVSFYRDGTLRSTGRGPRRIAPEPNARLVVGGHSFPDHFMGLVAEIRIWERAQDPAEIATRHTRRLTTAECADSTLVAYWPCDEGRGTTARDASGNRHALSLQRDDWPWVWKPGWYPVDLTADTLGIDRAAAPPRLLLPGFAVREFARLPARGPNYGANLAVAPRTSAFPAGIYVALTRSDGDMQWDVRDRIMHIDPQGKVKVFAEIPAPDAEISDLKFSPNAEWGDYLYVCANNLDGFVPWDGGGTILRLDPEGRISSFVQNSQRLNEPSRLTFATAEQSDYPAGLYITNMNDPPAGILFVTSRGEHGAWRSALASCSVAFGPGGGFGRSLYGAANQDSILYRIDILGNATPWVVVSQPNLWYLRSSNGGSLGTHLWSRRYESLSRIDSTGAVQLVLTDIGSTALSNNGFDVDPPGDAIYIADALQGRVWVLEAPAARSVQ